MVNIDEYQSACLRTAGQYDHHSMLVNGALGITGESGECADIVKKTVYQGHKLDTKHLKEELGDVCWYIALLATAIDVDLSDVLESNINKLKKRYPDGFDCEKSINRE